MCGCCYRNGHRTRILSAGGCPGLRSLHCCLLCLGDWNSGCYWECLGHVCLFLVSEWVMIKNVVVCHCKLLAFSIAKQQKRLSLLTLKQFLFVILLLSKKLVWKTQRFQIIKVSSVVIILAFRCFHLSHNHFVPVLYLDFMQSLILT